MTIDRIDALMWLMNEFGSDLWPKSMDKFATGRLIGNWRFVDTLPDREIMFCNMVDPGISHAELVDMENRCFGEKVIH